MVVFTKGLTRKAPIGMVKNGRVYEGTYEGSPVGTVKGDEELEGGAAALLLLLGGGEGGSGSSDSSASEKEWYIKLLEWLFVFLFWTLPKRFYRRLNSVGKIFAIACLVLPIPIGLISGDIKDVGDFIGILFASYFFGFWGGGLLGVIYGWMGKIYRFGKAGAFCKSKAGLLGVLIGAVAGGAFTAAAAILLSKEGGVIILKDCLLIAAFLAFFGSILGGFIGKIVGYFTGKPQT